MGNKRKKKYVPQHIYCETFLENYYVSYGTPLDIYLDSVNKIVGHRPSTENFESGNFSVYRDKDGIQVNWIWTKDKDIPDLVHEVFHAVHFVMMKKGLKLSDDSEEAYAYQLEFLMKKILKGESYGKRKKT